MDVNYANVEKDVRQETLDYVMEIRFISRWLNFSF